MLASVSPTPASGTPQLTAYNGTTEQVRQLAQCGGTMYAVGTFTSIQQGSNVYTRNNIFSFSATSPYTPYWFCEKAGMVLTASPGARPCTPSPTASTVPAAS